VLSTLSPGGDERRTGPTLPCDGLFGRSKGSKARPLTFPVATWFNLREADLARRPGSLPPRRRQEARLPRSGASSINRCSQAPCLRRMLGNPPPFLRGVAACESASGDPLRSPLNVRQVPTCVVLRRSSLEDLHCQWPEAFAPDGRQIEYAACQLLQSSRFLSTTVDLTATPHVPPRVTPLRCVDCGQRRVFRRVAG
jgi:hypothetical protein